MTTEKMRELMLRLSKVNNQLNCLQMELAEIHGQLEPEQEPELSQASQAAQNNVNELKKNIFPIYDHLDKKLNGEDG